MTSKAERQPAHTRFVPWNKKSCSTNVMVAVALQAISLQAVLVKGSPKPSPPSTWACILCSSSWSLVPVTALSLLLCWCLYLQSHVITQISVGNNPFSDFVLFYPAQLCSQCGERAETSKAVSMEVVGLLFRRPPAYMNTVQVESASLAGS